MSAAVDPGPLVPYGWSDRWVALVADADVPDGRPGRVVRHDGVAVLTALSTGVAHLGLRPGTPAVAVGDWVVADPEDRVAVVLPRRSLLSRRDPDEEVDQPVAANVDAVLVVCGLDRPVRAGRIQRSVAQAWDAGAVPLVVLTKADLDPTGEVGRDAVSIVSQADPSVDVVTVSADDGSGIDGLRERIADRTIVLFGESGAGKSTLLNALAGEQRADTGAVRTGDAKGRHTTTARTLHLLPGGGCVIDTPGVRAVGLSADADTVEATFEDIADLADGCRFRDCRHESEPGCAVKAAVDGGTVAAERLEAFLRLRREAEATALRNDVAARRKADRRFGRVVREAQRHKGPRP